MKSIIYKIKVAAIIFVGVLASSHMQAQSDLGVVWQKDDFTMLSSNFHNITKQWDGTYLASGYITENGRLRGYVVQFDESGKKKNEWILTPPADRKEWTDGGNTAIAQVWRAFITLSGDMIAFGMVHNSGADNDLKGIAIVYDSYLKNGIWVTKVSATGDILTNDLHRGNSVVHDAIYDGNDNYIIVGMDYGLTVDKWYLIRRYNADGTILWDNYNNGINYSSPGLRSVQITKTGSNYIIVDAMGTGGLHNTNFIFLSTPFTALNNGEHCIDSKTASVPNGFEPRMSLKNDGGFWFAGRMGSNVNGIAYGWAMAEKNSADALMECKAIQLISELTTKAYSAPLLLPGMSNAYVGTLNTSGINRMYICTDINPGFTLDPLPAAAATAIQYPYNTVLNNTSHTDGFFSCGQNPINGSAAVAKLSTCVNFKSTEAQTLQDNEIIVDHAPSININLPINYQGAKAATLADVKYDLQVYVVSGTVNNIPPSVNGGQLENLSNQPVITYGSGGGKALDLNRTYTLAEGPVVIKYILTIKDSYLTGSPSVAQSCGQTYVFYLRSVPQSDVVAMPTIVKDGQGGATIKASIKNIGLASFSTQFNITVYKDAVGDATKHIYAYTNTIARNETVDFKISIPNFDTVFAGATKIVVNFNDNGNGTRDQPEYDETAERDYEINL